MKLAEAQQARRERATSVEDSIVEHRLDVVGLSEQDVERISLGTADVSPEDRKKLKGIIGRLRRQKHTFTTCMRDLRKNQPDWSEDRRKRTCAVLKALAKPGSKGSANLAVGCDVRIDPGVAALIEHADLSGLEG